MNIKLKILSLFALSIYFLSCTKKEEDEGKLPYIAFKQESGYTSESESLDAGSTALVGIDAHKTEDKDVLTRFNISLSENGSEFESVYNKVLSGTEANTFSFDTLITMDSVSGKLSSYIFTVTNRDGLINKVSIDLTVK